MEAKITRICVDCGDAYELTEQQRDGFLEKGLKLPRRCIACRFHRRHEREREVSDVDR